MRVTNRKPAAAPASEKDVLNAASLARTPGGRTVVESWLGQYGYSFKSTKPGCWTLRTHDSTTQTFLNFRSDDSLELSDSDRGRIKTFKVDVSLQGLQRSLLDALETARKLHR